MEPRNKAWIEVEIRDAVKSYFALLDAQEKFEPINKSAIYRNLSAIHPVRSAKSFELKF